jgi:hypothetical protein
MERTDGSGTRKQRFPVDIEALVIRADGSKLMVTLSDFSEQGCRVDTDAEFHVGEKLQIAVPRMGSIRAQVRWAEPGSVGTRFLTETDC